MPRLKFSLKKTSTDVAEWVDRRMQVGEFIKDSALHPAPKSTASWFYVFGSAAFALLILQILTGIMLALFYVPSAGQAWQSLNFIDNHLILGWFVRAMHGWGSNFMIAVVIIHMIQVFLFGAYKFPRELTWLLGVGLLLLTLGMGFTGEVMRFDQDAFWGIGIGASIMGRVPFIGNFMVHALLGGPMIGGATLTRFFALHVFVIPGLLLAFAGAHVWLVLKLGINEWPMPGRIVRRSTYMKEYHELIHKDGIAFVPGVVWKDMFFMAAIYAAVAVTAVIFGPYGPKGQPDPIIIQTAPAPDYFFLWIYSILSYLPETMETPFILIVPVIAIAVLVAVPFVAGEGEKHWTRRPVAVLTILTLGIGLAILNHLGTYEPWSPHMTAWSWNTIPSQHLKNASPTELAGAVVFQGKQCRNCHELGGEGGQRGPALDDVANRQSYNELVRQVLQGGGNMPAYGKNLSPAEVTSLIAFLETLHRPGEHPSFDQALGEGRPDNSYSTPLFGEGPKQNQPKKPKAAPNQVSQKSAAPTGTTVSMNTHPVPVAAH